MVAVLQVVVAAASLLAVVAALARPAHRRPPALPALVVVAALLVVVLLPPPSADGSGVQPSSAAAGVAVAALAVLQMQLLRRRLTTSATRSWLDLATGVPAGLALVWAFATTPVALGAGVSEGRAAVLLVPLGLAWLVLTFCLTTTALLRPPDRRMLVHAVAAAVLVVAEVSSASALAGQSGGALADAAHPTAAALVALAAWLRDPHADERALESGGDIVIGPVSLTLQGTALLGWHLVSPIPEPAAWASLAIIVLVTAKTAVVFQQLDVLNALRSQATTDALTGLGNRRALDHALAVVDAGVPVALVVLDLDRFKAVNDTLGHRAGDDLLVALAGRLREDSGSGEHVVRLGGDEFALVLPHSDLPAAERRARSAVAALARPVDLDGGPVQVGASAGVAAAPLHATSARALWECADAAMYAAKRRDGAVVVAPLPEPAAGAAADAVDAVDAGPDDDRRRTDRRVAERRGGG